MDLFDFPQYQIKNKIRLIELFAGVGSQAMALRDIGADFEHWRVCEFDKYAIASYNAIHNTNFEPSDITKLKGTDLGITDTDKYTYLMTYSFPCQDLSLAGKQKGMKKGSSTRSGLLWEVERLLNETENLPQILLMENVPQVHAEKNMPDFQKWLEFLRSKGYHNFYQDLNAKDYGVPQNRERCFCVSILSPEYVEYEFPTPIKLTKVMKDLLEPEVDEKYYINSPKAKELIEKLIVVNKIKEEITVDLCLKNPNYNQDRVYDSDAVAVAVATSFQPNYLVVAMRGRNPENPSDRTPGIHTEQRLEPNSEGICNTLPTVQKDNLVLEQETIKIKQATKKGYTECKINGVADFAYPDSKTRRARVIQNGEVSPTLMAENNEIYKIENGFYKQALKVVEENEVKEGDIVDAFNERVLTDGISPTVTTRPEGEKTAILPVVEKYRIRKLTPKECWRLMGFTDEDFEKAAMVNSNSQLYKQAGNSIVKNVLMAIFNKMEVTV